MCSLPKKKAMFLTLIENLTGHANLDLINHRHMCVCVCKILHLSVKVYYFLLVCVNVTIGFTTCINPLFANANDVAVL